MRIQFRVICCHVVKGFMTNKMAMGAAMWKEMSECLVAHRGIAIDRFYIVEKKMRAATACGIMGGRFIGKPKYIPFFGYCRWPMFF